MTAPSWYFHRTFQGTCMYSTDYNTNTIIGVRKFMEEGAQLAPVLYLNVQV